MQWVSRNTRKIIINTGNKNIEISSTPGVVESLSSSGYLNLIVLNG